MYVGVTLSSKNSYRINVCTLASRIIVMTSVAIPACSLTITRRLYMISRSQVVMASKKEVCDFLKRH